MKFELKKLKEYLRNSNQWIIEFIENVNIIEMCEEFMIEAEYDGDPVEDTTSGLFEAFIAYKNNILINKFDAKYLKKRGGILGKYIEEFKTCFSAKDLIKLIDGVGFEKWLNSKECYTI